MLFNIGLNKHTLWTAKSPADIQIKRAVTRVLYGKVIWILIYYAVHAMERTLLR